MAKCESIGLYFINEQLQNRKCQNSDVFKTTYQSPTNVFVLFIYHWGHWRTRADFGTMALAMTLVAKSVGKCFVDWCRLLQQALASFKCIDAGKWCKVAPDDPKWKPDLRILHWIWCVSWHWTWRSWVLGAGSGTSDCSLRMPRERRRHHVVPTGKKMKQAWCIAMYYYVLLCITMYY